MRFPAFPVSIICSVSSMTLAGLKLGGTERGVYSCEGRGELEDFFHYAVHASDVVDLPIPEGIRGEVRTFERILHDVENLLQAKGGERLGPESHSAVLALFGENILIVTLPHGHEKAVVVGVKIIINGALVPLLLAALPLTVVRNFD